MWDNCNFYALLLGDKMAATLKNRLGISINVEHIFILRPNNPTPGYFLM